ncbi:hypothetical protein G17_00065 [Escherichia phage vB_EcoM_G17]|uniref:Uncharacterized protein n=1 Tax=Escherichia phage vB_Eco_slurp01 TaxID=1874688 RepID=A0A1C3S6I7_9CAUD|nr:hypothetical protein B1K96_15320 [Escherichia coli]QBO61561.1 hypothetical protein G17_00065 [Escherichia phage vB_EcoM_G17]QDF14170.1 hypothetical protein vBEcoMphAPEC6_gp547c [Escherichia phage vB_EcoM_phAPEC6]WNN14392.1 hypothetical protein Sharanji_gp104 [Escherichia phage Sharanji]SCA80133.1 hypothetical protein PSLUR01_00156 [Escherichia phage vB_Eco_slurp01]
MKTTNIHQYYIDILPKDVQFILKQEFSTLKKLKRTAPSAIIQHQKNVVRNILQGTPGTEYFNIVRLITL